MSEDRASCAATHEAAHAVVAAHLRFPFSSVTIKHGVLNGTKIGGRIVPRQRQSISVRSPAYDRKTRTYLPLTDQQMDARIERESDRQLTTTAIVGLAARAEINRQGRDEEAPEIHYGFDEQTVAFLYPQLRVAPPDFLTWRAAMYQQARRIVSLACVSDTIESVAYSLDTNKTVSSAHVRAVLKLHKAYYGGA